MKMSHLIFLGLLFSLSFVGKTLHAHENEPHRGADRMYANETVNVTDPWYHPDHVYVYKGNNYPVYYSGYPYYYYDPRYYYFEAP